MLQVKNQERDTRSEITLAKNKAKDIKVIRSLENRGTLLKGTTRKINSQKEGLFKFITP